MKINLALCLLGSVQSFHQQKVIEIFQITHINSSSKNDNIATTDLVTKANPTTRTAPVTRTSPTTATQPTTQTGLSEEEENRYNQIGARFSDMAKKFFDNLSIATNVKTVKPPAPVDNLPKFQSTPGQSCGISAKNNISAIQRGELPWHATLNFDNKKSPNYCSATIISDRHLITAAHCVATSAAAAAIDHYIFNSINVFIGGVQNNGADQQSYMVPMSKDHITVHEKWHSSRLSAGYDIAILKTWDQMKLVNANSMHDAIINGNFIAAPACLPKYDDFIVPCLGHDEMLIVRGEFTGYSKENDSTTEIRKTLHRDVVDIHPHDLCNYWWGGQVNDRTTCADGYTENGKLINSCAGGAGGPLIVHKSVDLATEGQRKEAAFLYGVTFFVSSDGCFIPEAPATYSRTEKYLDWIHANIGEEVDWGYISEENVPKRNLEVECKK